MRNEKVYKRINDYILEKIESGKIPWQQPWKNFFNKNFTSGHVYRGSNIWTLNMVSMINEFEYPLWAGMKQINKVKGKILKGEKGVPILIVFKKKFTAKDKYDEDGNPLVMEYIKVGYTFVWNISQTDIDPTKYIEEVEEDHKEIPKAESIVSGYPNPPTIKNKGSCAYYTRLKDLVVVPSIKVHNSEAGYYSTLFHELIHSTGHEKRLNRLGDSTNKKEYSFEELVAELGACYLNNIVGIQTEQTQTNSAAYIQGWIKYLKSNPKAFIQAGSAAEKAVQHILGE